MDVLPQVPAGSIRQAAVATRSGIAPGTGVAAAVGTAFQTNPDGFRFRFLPDGIVLDSTIHKFAVAKEIYRQPAHDKSHFAPSGHRVRASPDLPKTGSNESDRNSRSVARGHLCDLVATRINGLINARF